MVDHLRNRYRAGERHACRVLRMVRGTYRYQSRQEPWEGVADADTRSHHLMVRSASKRVYRID
jgi:hypothetical protein